MRTTTAEQLIALSQEILGQRNPVEQTQALIDSGILGILCRANFSELNFDAFCQACGLDSAKERERRAMRTKVRKDRQEKGLTPLDLFGRGLTVDLSDGTCLFCRPLLIPTPAAKILQALGGKERAEVTCQERREFLKTADHCQQYLFFIGDEIVEVDWCCDCWRSRAYSIERRFRWLAGYQVVSRKCSVLS